MSEAEKLARKSVPVLLSVEAYEMAKEYGADFDMALTKVTSRAVIEWCETIGAARREALLASAQSGKKVLQFKSPEKEPAVATHAPENN